jgi:hypothetical protein
MSGPNAISKTPRRLRFAVFLDERQPTRWDFECVSLLAKSAVVQFELLVIAARPWSSHLLSKCLHTLRHILWFAFVATVGRPRSEERAESYPVPVSTIRLFKTANDANCLGLSSADIDRLLGYRLDFVLYFGAEPLNARIPHIAKYGVWAFCHGEPQPHTTNPPAFWEMFNRESITHIGLRRFSPLDPHQSVLLRRAWVSVIPHSFARTVDAARSASADFPLLATHDILGGRNVESAGDNLSAEHSFASLPSNTTMFLFAVKMLCAKGIAFIHALFTRVQWGVGVINFLDVNPHAKSELKNVRWLPGEGRNGFGMADPFFRLVGDDILLLAETMKPREQRGLIVASRVNRERAVSLGIAIEEKGVHLSYPYLFEWSGQIYCVPEQWESGAVVLYRAIDFPSCWERAGTILSGVNAADPTLFRFGSYWWLAYTEVRPRLFSSSRRRKTLLDSVSRLMLWYARKPTGPWMPHALNPVKTDPRSSRGAGTPFYYQGMLVRPTQDCSVDYGAKIIFNHIVVLTPTQFEETSIGELRPDPASLYPRGVHTISYHGDIAVIDGWRRLFAPMAWLSRVQGVREEARGMPFELHAANPSSPEKRPSSRSDFRARSA